MHVQKSYLSKVLNGDDADFNSDQLYLLALHFGLSDEDTDYMQLLLEFARTSVKKRKLEMKQKIQAVQSQHLASEKYLKLDALHEDSALMNDYYLDAYNPLVHVCLSQKEYQKNPSSLAGALGIKKERLEEILLELQRLRLISFDAGMVKVQQENFHLSKTSKLFRAWMIQMRQMALQRSLQSHSNENYHFSVIFSCTETIKKEIQAKFFAYIQDAQTRVTPSEAEHVYQMNFDLIDWT
jgi:hypothetical protein